MHSQRSVKASKPRIAKATTKPTKQSKLHTKKVAKRAISTTPHNSATTRQFATTPSVSLSSPLPTPHLSFTTPSFTPQTSPRFPPAPFLHQHRSMATFKKVGSVERTVLTAESIAQEKQKKEDAKVEVKKSTKVPTLNDLMRRFYKKIHPDLMMAYPEQKEQNEKSLAIFQNFLSMLKSTDGDEKWPTVRNAALSFYLRTATPGHFQHVQLLLHTDGAMNKKLVQRQLCTFFGSIGLSSTFVWDEEYFAARSKPSLKGNDDEKAEGGEDQQPSSSQNPNESYDEFMSRIKREAAKTEKTQQM